ncbi:12454_t:CDS:2, partial [Racocetra fulgida]
QEKKQKEQADREQRTQIYTAKNMLIKSSEEFEKEREDKILNLEKERIDFVATIESQKTKLNKQTQILTLQQTINRFEQEKLETVFNSPSQTITYPEAEENQIKPKEMKTAGVQTDKNLDGTQVMFLAGGVVIGLALFGLVKMVFGGKENRGISGKLIITDFPQLEKIYVRKNKLTQLRLNNCSQLTYLYCRSNKLTELIITNCPNLQIIDASINQLTNLDLSNNRQLEELNISNNQLVKLDLTNCQKTKVLYGLCKKCNQLNTSSDYLERLTGEEEFTNIEYLAEGGVSEIILKSLNNSQNITLEFLREIANINLARQFSGGSEKGGIVKCYGITQSTATKNYFMVMQYMNGANSYPYPKTDEIELSLKICQGYRPNIDELEIPQLLKDLIKKKESIEFKQQYQSIKEKYNHFSENTPYQIHPSAITTSKMINTKEITTRL